MTISFFVHNVSLWDWIGKLIDQLRDRLAPRPALRPIPIPLKNEGRKLPRR